MPRLMITLLLLLSCLNVQADLTPVRQQELMNILQQDCGSCHGLTLKGGLGPPLHPENLANLPRQFIVDTILYGRPGTPMPPWQPILTLEEINWIVDVLYRGDAL